MCNEDGECITWYPDMFCDGKDDLANGYDEAACKGMNHLYFYQSYKVLLSIYEFMKYRWIIYGEIKISKMFIINSSMPFQNSTL